MIITKKIVVGAEIIEYRVPITTTPIRGPQSKLDDNGVAGDGHQIRMHPKIVVSVARDDDR